MARFRPSILALIVCTIVVFVETGSRASDLEPNRTDVPVEPDVPSTDERVRTLVEGGLHALSTYQNPDGSFGGKKAQTARIAITSLSLLAFLADGHSEHRGAYAQTVKGAVGFLCRSSQESGSRIGCFETIGDVASRMHGHGYATLALCQVYGQYGVGRKFAGTSEALKQIIANAVDVIVRSQNSSGGWYYFPLDSVEDEGSITVCMIQALRAARNCGFAVSSSVIEKAVNYIRTSQNVDGSVRYSLRSNKVGTFELTAAACATLAYGGRYKSQEVIRARSYLWENRPNIFSDSSLSYPYYGYFYALQALWFDYDANRWNDMFPKFVSWYWKHWDEQSQSYAIVPWGRHKEMEYGIEYRTALATLSLQIPNHLLPIFNR